MTRNTLALAVSAALTLSLLGCSSDDNSTSGGLSTSAAPATPTAPAVEATPANITLDLIGRHASGEFLKSAAKSPNGKPLLIVGNEVSGTTAVYEIRQTF